MAREAPLSLEELASILSSCNSMARAYRRCRTRRDSSEMFATGTNLTALHIELLLTKFVFFQCGG
jgi:hypothetical protein